MSNKKQKEFEPIKIETEMLGIKIHLYDLCGCCLQEIKSSWTTCQYCEAKIVRKDNNEILL